MLRDAVEKLDKSVLDSLEGEDFSDNIDKMLSGKLSIRRGRSVDPAVFETLYRSLQTALDQWMKDDFKNRHYEDKAYKVLHKWFQDHNWYPNPGHSEEDVLADHMKDPNFVEEIERELDGDYETIVAKELAKE